MSVVRKQALSALAGIVVLASGCSDGAVTSVVEVTKPRLNSRPVAFATPSLTAGTHRVNFRGTQILAYVPASALNRQKVPVNLLLHGSARDAEPLLAAHVAGADKAGVVVIAPYAASGTWDAINTTFGPDVAGIDRALAWLFDRLPVDPDRIAITGFSDGATYTLALGRANGDLFSRVVAYSPGFLIDVEPVGHPAIAISHGTHDEELPYTKTRDQIVPGLKNKGYSVDFRTFEGPHTILAELVEETLEILADFH